MPVTDADQTVPLQLAQPGIDLHFLKLMLQSNTKQFPQPIFEPRREKIGFLHMQTRAVA